MRDLSLHLLDLGQNSLAAGATLLRLSVRWEEPRDRLSLALADNGRGLSPQQLAQAMDPFFTSRETRRVGLGLPLFQMACQLAGGDCRISTRPGRGTVVRGWMSLSHWDRKPMGDLGETLAVLAQSGARVVFTFRADRFPPLPALRCRWDTRLWRQLLGEEAFSCPAVFDRFCQEITGRIGGYQ